MEKYQLYRTALDALQFLASSELGFADSERLVFQTFACEIADKLKDCFEVVSK